MSETREQLPILLPAPQDAEMMRRYVWLCAWVATANISGPFYAQGWADGAVREFDACFAEKP